MISRAKLLCFPIHQRRAGQHSCDSVVHHAKHFNIYEDFITQEIQWCGKNAVSALLLCLEKMYGDDTFMSMLHAKLRVVAYTNPIFIHLMDYFQQRIPHVTQSHNKMKSLFCILHSNSSLSKGELKFCFQGTLMLFTSKWEVWCWSHCQVNSTYPVKTKLASSFLFIF